MKWPSENEDFAYLFFEIKIKSATIVKVFTMFRNVNVISFSYFVFFFLQSVIELEKSKLITDFGAFVYIKKRNVFTILKQKKNEINSTV